ncbi:MAG: TRAP transporter small permease [Dysosmobacter sp.]|nr:TRAP transporter small permease [Dysosmobacter sp.]
MDNAKLKHIFYEVLNRFELYIGCVLFLIMMVLLTVQVISRYAGHAITWTEELSCIMLVWMSYLGFAGAITSRKHLRIDAFINSRSFKVKKMLLIVSNVINAFFAALLISPMYNVVVTFRSINAVSPIMRIPKSVAFAILPICMALIIIRTVQECIRLAKEEEKQLGVGKPTFDVDALEQEYLERVQREKEAEDK